MSALDPARPERLAELLVSAATLLTESDPARRALSPTGIPVRRGRLHLGRLRHVLGTAEPVAVTAGFATAARLGPRDVTAPDLGRLAYRTETSIDGRYASCSACGCAPGWASSTRWRLTWLRCRHPRVGC